MSQQEFEPSQEETEMYRPKYPYTWSDGEQPAAMPRDEPPSTYGTYAPQYQVGQPQVPWWARPQPGQTGPIILAAMGIIAILLTLVMGGLGIVGIIFASLLHLAGLLIGAIFALLICFVLLIVLVLSLLRRAFGKTFGSSQTLNRRPPGA